MAHIGMEDKRHVGPSNALEYPLESAMMIGMSMREDHGTQVIRLHFEHVHVVKHSVAAQSGIIQHRFAAPFSLYGQQQRIAVFCNQLLALGPAIVKWRTMRYLVAGHEDVEGIIHHDCDVCGVNW